MKLGIFSDIHGDFTGMQRALDIIDQQHVYAIVCAGDVADRGPHADQAVVELQRRNIPCVQGNHDITISQFRNRVRNPERVAELRRLGRIVEPQTTAYLEALPPTLVLHYGAYSVLLAHGAPWSDVVGVFPDTSKRMLDRLDTYAEKAACGTIILGHTHAPMHIRTARGVNIINPGSIYNVTIRDSGTCAVYDLEQRQLVVYDLKSGEPLEY